MKNFWPVKNSLDKFTNAANRATNNVKNTKKSDNIKLMGGLAGRLGIVNSSDIKTVARDARCIICKGSRMLCGKSNCPVLVRFYAQMKTKSMLDSLSNNLRNLDPEFGPTGFSELKMEGSSPPSVFIGRFGWPNVYVGPMIPPTLGDTAFLDTPELWRGKTIQEIVEFRSQLVRGKTRVHVKELEKNRIVEQTREIALSKDSADVDAVFFKKPAGALVVDEDVQPYGPSAVLKNLNLSSVKADQKVEKAFYDTDLKAAGAVIRLYEKGVFVSRIQRAFSAGLFGLGKNRKFVPTRWSITAVDDTISKNLVKQVKEFPLINEYRVYEHTALDNKWIVLMVPDYWSYEQFEAWSPGTTWNTGSDTWIISDWEGFDGRTTYPKTGGCYFSTRLATGEALTRERRQAAVITLREIHPGYILPVGVFHTRESIREAVKKKPLTFSNLEDSLNYISSKLNIPIKNWIENGTLLKKLLYQRKIFDFIKKNSAILR